MIKNYLIKRTAVIAMSLGMLFTCQSVTALADDMMEEEDSYVVMDEGEDLEAAYSMDLLAGSDSYDDDDAIIVDEDASDAGVSSGIVDESDSESSDLELSASDEDTTPVFSFTQQTCSLVAPNTATINITGDTGSAASWSVSDPNVIKITSKTSLKATIKAVGEGTADLIAISEDGQQAVCTVTVTLPAFDFPETLLLEINKSESFSFPSNLEITSKVSSNSDIVSVSGYSYVYLKGEGLGTATVTLTDSFGRVKTCKVTVKEHVLCFKESEITFDVDSSKTVDISKGKAISVESSDESVATVTLNSYYISVKGISTGTATITAQDKYGEVATLIVHVVYPEFALASDEVTITGGYDNKTLIRTSSGSVVSAESANEEIVKCETSYSSRYIYGVGLGETDVVCKDKYGQECTLHVIVTAPTFTTNLEEVKYKASKEKPSTTVTANNDISKIEIADPSIVQATLEKSTTLKLTALHAGNTEVTIYDNFGNSKTLPVEITGSIHFDKEELTLTSANCYNGTLIPNYLSIYYFDDVTSLTSSNRKIVDVKLYYEKGQKSWYIDPINVGTATIYAHDCFGYTASVTVTVSVDYMNAVIRGSDNTKVNYCLSGKGSITGTTLPGAVVSTVIGGRKYKTVVGNSGYFYLRIPVAKVGTVYRLTFSYRKGSFSRNVKVLPYGSFSWSYIYSSTKTVKVTAHNVHAGDKLVLKIGKKKYTKKIKKNASKKTIKFKIKKGSLGKTVSLTLYNKYGQLLDYDDDVIYYAKNIKMGMTKKQVENLVYWGYPDSTSKSSGGWTYWYYDDGSCVGFKNGRVKYYYY